MTPAQQAFADFSLASGLDIEHVARVVSLSPDYLKTQLRTGCRCYVTADRLRRVLGCPVEVFLPRPKNQKPKNQRPKTKPKSTKERGRATDKTAQASSKSITSSKSRQ